MTFKRQKQQKGASVRDSLGRRIFRSLNMDDRIPCVECGKPVNARDTNVHRACLEEILLNTQEPNADADDGIDD